MGIIPGRDGIVKRLLDGDHVHGHLHSIDANYNIEAWIDEKGLHVLIPFSRNSAAETGAEILGYDKHDTGDARGTGRRRTSHT